MGILALIGTDKGAFALRTGASRERWTVAGPMLLGWKVTATARDPRGRTYAATASDVYGPALHASDDARTWRQLDALPAWAPESSREMRQIWTLVCADRGAGRGERLYAGVDDAGLFASDDRGRTWRGLDGLNEHPTRASWYPGAGGLCLHAVLIDPRDPRRIWTAISSVGVLRSDDGGATWEHKNAGIPPMLEDPELPEIGRCVHALAADPDDADTIWRREHNGMFRTRDGGERWERVEHGLGSWFGFPLALDRRTKHLYDVPLESDEHRVMPGGAMALYKSTDGGASWHALRGGLPQQHAYAGVLRGALALDHRDPCGVVFGTTAGAVFASRDAGATFARLDCTLPRILSVELYDA
jgi:photosystem II stability/assembly factor-like uncharacterized protein